VKRLRGWDAVLLYSETPNVHMHTLKLAVIEIGDLRGRKFGVEEFRNVLHGRLYKLDPFRYQLNAGPAVAAAGVLGARGSSSGPGGE
jgi:diacylglycerol O-acyltransferase